MNTHSANHEEVLIIDKPLKKFRDNIDEIEKVRSIGKEIIDFSVGSLSTLKDEIEKEKCYGISRKVENTIKAIKNIENPESRLHEKYIAINNQSMILLISNFERFLSDYTVLLVENYSYLIEWPEKKLAIDFKSFTYGVPSVGEIVLHSLREKYSFQDLQSIKNFVKDILRVEIELEDLEENKIIFFHALRHILVHNLGMVDAQFLKQIRNVDYRSFFPEYISREERIDVSDDLYTTARNIFIKLAELIHAKVREDLAPF